MTRPNYAITETDLTAAAHYIDSKLRGPYWPSDDTKARLSAARSFKNARRDPVTLTKWVEKHLDASQMGQLKGAIRQARKRVADLSRDKPKSVNLSHKAWLILSDLAKADGVTLSQVIEARLAKT
jgi:macrodomain Ter protein organizer (MatP/YcbG family)